MISFFRLSFVTILFSSFSTSSPPVKSLYRTCFINLRQADECPIRLPYKSCVFYSFSSPQWQCFLQFDALGHPTGIPFFLFFYDVTNTECKNCQYDKYNNNICHVNPPFQLIKRILCLQLLVRMNTQICYKCCYYQHCNQSANKACSKRTCCN